MPKQVCHPAAARTTAETEDGAQQFGLPGLSADRSSCSALRDMAVTRKLAPGDVLFWEDDAVDGTYLLTDGVMKGYKLLPNGRSQIVRFPVGGEVVASTLCKTHGFSAEALTSCVVIVLPRRPLEALLARDATLMRSLAGKLGDEMQMAHKQVLLLGRMPAIERVSHFLLDFAMRKHSGERLFVPDLLIELPMSRTDIADYLGLTIETVSRIFSRFRRDGLIDLPRPNLVVLHNHHSLWQREVAQVN